MGADSGEEVDDCGTGSMALVASIEAGGSERQSDAGSEYSENAPTGAEPTPSDTGTAVPTPSESSASNVAPEQVERTP